MERGETGAEWSGGFWRRDRNTRTDLLQQQASHGPERPNTEEAESGLWFGESVEEGGGGEEEGEGRGLSFG